MSNPYVSLLVGKVSNLRHSYLWKSGMYYGCCTMNASFPHWLGKFFNIWSY